MRGAQTPAQRSAIIAKILKNQKGGTPDLKKMKIGDTKQMKNGLDLTKKTTGLKFK